MICFVFKRRRGARYYSGKLRMPWDERTRVIALETTDKRVAQRKLDDIARDLHLEHQGLLAPSMVREAAAKLLDSLVDSFVADLQAKGRTQNTIRKYAQGLRRLFRACGWRELRSVNASAFCAWRAQAGLAPKSLNDALANLSVFLNWLHGQGMVAENVMRKVSPVDMRLVRPCRRALSFEEVNRLLRVAPFERAVVYLVVLNTGLRRKELNGLRWADFVLDGAQPYVVVPASISKNKKEARLVLRREVVEALERYRPEMAIPDEWVFRSRVPKISTLRRDLAAAGIEYRDAMGRRADLHAMRLTFGTNLSVGGVAPRVAMEMMRHSDIKLTMRVYTDASQLPVQAAIGVLPGFTLRNLGVQGGVQNCVHGAVSGGLKETLGDAAGRTDQLLHSAVNAVCRQE